MSKYIGYAKHGAKCLLKEDNYDLIYGQQYKNCHLQLSLMLENKNNVSVANTSVCCRLTATET